MKSFDSGEAKFPPQEALFVGMQRQHELLANSLADNKEVREAYIHAMVDGYGQRDYGKELKRDLEKNIPERVWVVNLDKTPIKLDAPFMDATEVKPLAIQGNKYHGGIFTALHLILSDRDADVPTKFVFQEEDEDARINLDKFTHGVSVYAAAGMRPFVAAFWDQLAVNDDYWYEGDYFNGEKFKTSKEEVDEKIMKDGVPDEGAVYLEALSIKGLEPDYLSPEDSQVLASLAPHLKVLS